MSQSNAPTNPPQRPTTGRVPRRRLRQPLIRYAVLLIVAVTLGSLLIEYWARDDASHSGWSVHTHGPAQALQRPSVIHTTNRSAMIWQPAGRTTPLVSEDLATGARTGILPYPDVHPQAWRGVAAGPGSFHLVWLERDGRLRSALIALSGETLRGPIVLAPAATADFELLPGNQGSGRVFWRTPSGDIRTAALDAEGRPGPEQPVLARRAQRLAAAQLPPDPQTGERGYFLAWLSAATPSEWALRGAQLVGDDWLVSPQPPLATVPVTPDDALAYLGASSDGALIYVMWALTSAAAPDRVQPAGIVLAPTASSSLAPVTLTYPPAAASDPVRWLALLPDAHTAHASLPLALALKTDDGWRLAVLTLQNGATLSAQIIANPPADAGPPVLSVMPDGTLLAAWSGLQSGRPALFTARAPS